MTINKKYSIIEAHQVPDELSCIRLQDYSLGRFKTYPTNSGIKKAIKKGMVFINGKRGYTADILSGGELIVVCKPFENVLKPTIEIPIEVIYEDDYLLVVNKPAGIEVSGNKKWTLENALQPHVQKSSQHDALSRPQPVHRLDYPTSGVLMAGKTAQAVQLLNKMFEHKQIQKIYMAVTIGEMKNVKGKITFPVDEKESSSSYRVLETVDSPRFSKLNLVQLLPHTGRRHQLRKHVSEIGNPILGDLQYGEEGLILKGKGLYLHACRLQFKHPFTDEELCVTAQLPSKYKKIFKESDRHCNLSD